MERKSTRFKVGELRKSKIKDKHKRPCPPDLPNIFRKAGVESFSCRDSGLDWDVVREDVKVLHDRLEGISVKE